MKKAYLTIFILAISISANSQVLSHYINMLEWSTKKSGKETLMFYDIPFKTKNADRLEHIGLSLLKTKKIERPEYFAVKVSKEIADSGELYMKLFRKYEGLDYLLDAKSIKNASIKIELTEKEAGSCEAKFEKAYIWNDKKEKTDILQCLQEGNYVLFFIIYPDQSFKKIGLPLDSFKKKYKKLK